MNVSSAMALVSIMPGAATPITLSFCTAAEMASSFLLQAVNSATKEVLHNAAINNMRFVLYICIIYRVTCVDDRFGVNHTRIREFRADAVCRYWFHSGYKILASP